MAKVYEGLAAKVASLTKRVGELEKYSSTKPSAAPAASSLDPDTFWALNGLRARNDKNSLSAGGEVMLLGLLHVQETLAVRPPGRRSS